MKKDSTQMPHFPQRQTTMGRRVTYRESGLAVLHEHTEPKTHVDVGADVVQQIVLAQQPLQVPQSRLNQ
jgi:hypothetical protein